MASGDGWLLRVKPSHSRLTAAQARALAGIARTHGNGIVELTARGNLQLRGLTEADARALPPGLVSLGLGSPDPEVERRRSILVSPLAGIDPACDDATLRIASVLETELNGAAELRSLPDKFGFAVDGGGLLPLSQMTADVVLRASPGGWRIEAGGGRATPRQQDANALASLAIRVARAAGSLPRRLAQDPAPGLALLRSLGLETRSRDAVGETAPSVERPPAAVGPIGALAMGVLLPGGQGNAGLLERLADAADGAGNGLLALTPWRSIVLPLAVGASFPAMAGMLGGLILDPEHPARFVRACAGRGGCPRGLADVRTDASRLAALLGRDAMRELGVLHLSGCRKGCAHPAPAQATLVAEAGGYGLVLGGTAGDEAAATGLSIAAAAVRLREVAAGARNRR
ncbi:precorrin-3B synthase [Acetobacteraceae bacterium KSS12]|uniref:Precorrin-3B synthase n=2 Tax=Rhizosaccharibacter radicis TaxID=2782605 RepID=A0ABT1VY79_9PROT|nr:precorrin-3B synthase [Acetobacteraceae bacterium KSS12]